MVKFFRVLARISGLCMAGIAGDGSRMEAPANLPHPAELFRLFESGRISREDLHRAIGAHARALVAEMVERRRRPLLAFADQLLAKREAAALARDHGEAALRELFSAMAEIPSFPPAWLLWNARHAEVPLHCFLRPKLPPVFRVVDLLLPPMMARVRVRHGMEGKVVTEEIILRRNRARIWIFESRRAV